jgi:DNA-binding transcriptional ArsR family regulator
MNYYFPRNPAWNKSDPREGKRLSASQTSMFDDADSVEKAPVKPYAGEHGHSGTDTSHARAKSLSSKNQSTVMRLLKEAKQDGMTVAEIREATDMHHGTASGSLTELHKGGLISRLAEKRGRCKVYVMPCHVGFRDSEAPKGTKSGLAARVLSAEISDDGSVRYNNEDFHSAADLLSALTEGFNE